jgi:HPt (histidine-containing phosphotransfer) domain-containing protein
MSAEFKEINLSYLESIADGDDEIIRELIEIFLDQVPEFTDGMDKHLINREWKDLAGLAHKAKSSVISMGMADLGNIDLKNLELIAKKYRLEELNGNSNRTDKETEEVNNLNHILSTYPQPKQEWLSKNASEQTMKEIVEKFKTACNQACNELNTFLETK